MRGDATHRKPREAFSQGTTRLSPSLSLLEATFAGHLVGRAYVTPLDATLTKYFPLSPFGATLSSNTRGGTPSGLAPGSEFRPSTLGRGPHPRRAGALC